MHDPYLRPSFLMNGKEHCTLPGWEFPPETDTEKKLSTFEINTITLMINNVYKIKKFHIA